jgi:hypothetical protein
VKSGPIVVHYEVEPRDMGRIVGHLQILERIWQDMGRNDSKMLQLSELIVHIDNLPIHD